MEYVDGEGSAASRAAIGTHLASCAACQAIAAEQRGISEHAQAWAVGSAPASLQPPAAPRARVLLPLVGAWRPARSVRAGLAAAAVLLLVVWSFQMSRLSRFRSPTEFADAQYRWRRPQRRWRRKARSGSGPKVNHSSRSTRRRHGRLRSGFARRW